MLLLRGSWVLLFHICRTVVLRKMRTSWKYCDMEKEIKTWSFCFRRRKDESQETSFFQHVCVCVCVCVRERERERERDRQTDRQTETDRNRLGPCLCLRAYVIFYVSTKLCIELHIFSLPKLYIIPIYTL